jgi:hypothetical protein
VVQLTRGGGRASWFAQQAPQPGATVLVVAKRCDAAVALSVGLLRLGVGRVVRAASPAALHEVLAEGPSGSLAVIGPGLAVRAGRLERQLKKAGWRKVMVFTPGTTPADVVAETLVGREAAGACQGRELSPPGASRPTPGCPPQRTTDHRSPPGPPA